MVSVFAAQPTQAEPPGIVVVSGPVQPGGLLFVTAPPGTRMVRVDGAGLVTLYVHLDSLGVKSGATVRKGDRLGTIGTTGRSTGPHLHWGLSLMQPAADARGEHVEIRLDPALILQ